METHTKDTITDHSTASKKKKGTKKRNNVFSKALKGTFLKNENVRKYYPFMIFLVLLAMLYIFNNYYAEKNHRNIKKLEPIHEAYQTGYRSAKAVFENHSRLSNISVKLESIGLKEARVSPRVLVDNEEENEE